MLIFFKSEHGKGVNLSGDENSRKEHLKGDEL